MEYVPDDLDRHLQGGTRLPWEPATEIAVQIARALASSTRSLTASVMGTPEYMSPEQWSSGNLDGRHDQYALGIVFYQMLVGTTPFQGESMEAIYVQHRETPLPAFASNLQVPRAVEQVIRRATERTCRRVLSHWKGIFR
jgi:serine/threonine protein kinase